jgi:gamma-glutamylcyclotransferase (GGCT)/AIG2-like uncharacterized protein YtfP
MHYFAYGSNMSSERLRRRVPSAQPIGHAELPAHRLHFHKPGRDGSAKCDIAVPGRTTDISVWGVVFRIDLDHKPRLDAAEDLHRGYGIKDVAVRLSEGRWLKAFTYYALQIDTRLRPYSWYREHVLRGAREHGLPADYVAMIEAIDCLEDHDVTRHQHELAVYA